MEQLAEFLLKYGWVGLCVILMAVVAFLYKENRRVQREKEEVMKASFEKLEGLAVRYAEAMEKMRGSVEELLPLMKKCRRNS